MSLFATRSIKFLGQSSIRTAVTINLGAVWAAFEDGYGDTRGNYPATKVIGSFGELLIDDSYDAFIQKWQRALCQRGS